FIITRGKVLSSTEVVNEQDELNPYPVYSSQTKNNGLMGYYSNFLFEDAITWTTDGANAGTVHYRSGKFYSTNVNGVLLSHKNYANKFIAENLNNIAWKHVSKVGNPKLMNNVMSEIIVIIPKVEEQHKLSLFLKFLDKSIELHQSKLEKLNKIKQVYLQKMF